MLTKPEEKVVRDKARTPLWDSYLTEPSKRNRDLLILEYAPLVKWVAGRMVASLPQHVEVADLVSFGIFGLVDAIEKFDVSLGFKFDTYAIPRIKGSIIDGLRAQDTAPRSLRSKSRRIKESTDTLESELGRYPTEQEIAQHVGMSVSDIRQIAFWVARAAPHSLDATFGTADDDFEFQIPSEDPAPSEGLEDRAVREMLSSHLATLPEQEKIALALYYFEGMSLSEIGEVMGVTESRVCQVHTKAIERLRGKMADSLAAE